MPSVQRVGRLVDPLFPRFEAAPEIISGVSKSHRYRSNHSNWIRHLTDCLGPLVIAVADTTDRRPVPTPTEAWTDQRGICWDSDSRVIGACSSCYHVKVGREM
jgi:hypothetical protein